MVPLTSQDVQEMSRICNSISHIDFGDLLGVPTATNSPAPKPNLNVPDFDYIPDNGISYDDWNLLQPHNNRVTPQDYISNYTTPSMINWVVEAKQHPKSKSINEYQVKANTGYCLVEGIYSKEAADFILRLINENVPLSDKRALGVLSIGLQYSLAVDSVIESLQKRQEVLRESNYEAAKQMDTKINSKKVEAQKLRDNLLEYINKNS